MILELRKWVLRPRGVGSSELGEKLGSSNRVVLRACNWGTGELRPLGGGSSEVGKRW
jgi:hypothetical protein